MGARAWLVAWLLTCAAVLLPVVPDAHPASIAAATAVVLLALTLAVAVGPVPGLLTVPVVAPARRRLRGRFLQQSRPGVPGRVRARAPGCGR